MVKIIHCSDLHLQSPLGGNYPPDKAKRRNAELAMAFARMVRFALEEQASAVLIAGDLFDSAYVSAHTVNFLVEQIRSAKDVTFFYLQGNHDEKIDIFHGINLPENLKTFGPKWESCRCGQVVITAMEPEGDLWLKMYDTLQLSPRDVNVVMLHGQIGSQPGKDQIALPLLRGKAIRYLALGHLHTYQKAPLDAAGEYCYPGCLEGRGFDECGEKGFVLLEVENDCVKSRFVPFAERTLHEIYLDISHVETVTQILSEMKQAAAGIAQKDLVKFVLTGTYTLQTQKDVQFLEKMLESDFWLVKVKDETTLKIDPKVYECDISLKGEFIRTVMNSGRAEAEKAQIISCGLRALNGQEVVL